MQRRAGLLLQLLLEALECRDAALRYRATLQLEFLQRERQLDGPGEQFHAILEARRYHPVMLEQRVEHLFAFIVRQQVKVDDADRLGPLMR